jgi:ribonuclease P protein component
LTQGKEFQSVLSEHYRVTGTHFLIKAQCNGLAAARLGLIASRKAARRAVDRNRAKRLARAIFGELRSGLPAADFVLQLRSDLRQSGNPEVRAELYRLLNKAAGRFGAAAAA